jgi:cyclophilin family peptidyl-prolyl cis-trans isomerase
MKNTFFFIALVLLFPTLLTAQTKVNFYTTKGNFVVTLEDTLAPITAGNFKQLVKEKYYDGVIFHRIIQNFVIQGGDGASGKPAIQDEFHPNLSNLQWTLSMANSGPNTGTTQFFINLKDNTFLDYDKAPLTSQHPVFGKVTENVNLIYQMGSVATDANDKPLVDIVMDSVRIDPAFLVGVQKINSVETTNLACYPNPISNNSVITGNGFEGEATCRIFDIQGKVVTSKQMVLQNSFTIPLENFTSRNLKTGVYFLEICNTNKTSRLKLMVN